MTEDRSLDEITQSFTNSLDELVYTFELLAAKLQAHLNLRLSPDDSAWWAKDKDLQPRR